MRAVEFFESTGREIKKWFANQGVKVKVRNIRGKYIHVAPVEGNMPNEFRQMVIDKVPFFQDVGAEVTGTDNIDFGNVRARYIAISPDQWDMVMAPEATRQLGDPSREVMVVKDGKVIVIDAEKEAEYLENGWELAESIDEATEQGRPHGAPHIENIRFWDLPDDELRFIMKDAKEAMDANPEAEKAITGPGNWADQVNDAHTVLGWRIRNPRREAKRKAKRPTLSWSGNISRFAEDTDRIKADNVQSARVEKQRVPVHDGGPIEEMYVLIGPDGETYGTYNMDAKGEARAYGGIKKLNKQFGIREGVSGPTRMQVQNHFDKLTGATRAKIRDTEQALNIIDLRIGGAGKVLTYREAPKKVTEGYEKAVLLILKGADIGGYFSDGILYVGKADELDAKQLVNSKSNILKAPKIIGEAAPSVIKKAGRRAAGSWGRPVVKSKSVLQVNQADSGTLAILIMEMTPLRAS